MHLDLFADYLDIVKWSALVELVGHYGIRRVVYVPMLHGSNTFLPNRGTVPQKYKSDLTNSSVAVDARVRAFFTAQRALPAPSLALSNLNNLASICGFSMEIVLDEFTHGRRRDYFATACAALRRLDDPSIVFVDPSTGVGINVCSHEHIAVVDLMEVYAALPSGSVLVVYQHMRTKSGQTLLERLDEVRALLRPALGVEAFPSQRYGPMGLIHCKKAKTAMDASVDGAPHGAGQSPH